MEHGAVIQDDQAVLGGNVAVILVFHVLLVETVLEEQEEHHVDDHDDAQAGQDIAQEEEGVVAQGTQPGHDVVHVIEGKDGHQQQKQDAEIRQAPDLADDRFHLVGRRFAAFRAAASVSRPGSN